MKTVTVYYWMLEKLCCLLIQHIFKMLFKLRITILGRKRLLWAVDQRLITG